MSTIAGVKNFQGRPCHIDAYVLVFLHLGNRRIYMSQPTFHPDESWLMQQTRNVTIWLDDHGIEAKYLIHNRDTKFTRQFDAFWKEVGVHCIRIPPKAPQVNAFCESFIVTCLQTPVPEPLRLLWSWPDGRYPRQARRGPLPLRSHGRAGGGGGNHRRLAQR